MKIEIELTPTELEALKREYARKGLGVNLPGNKPSPLDNVTKKIVEKAK